MLRDEFPMDDHGKRFPDMFALNGFDLVLEFFESADRQRRMIESEVHHDRPALAGVVRELEAFKEISEIFDQLEAKTKNRFRQAIGVIVRLVMKKHGCLPLSRRGSLTAISKWFARSERYLTWNEVVQPTIRW